MYKAALCRMLTTRGAYLESFDNDGMARGARHGARHREQQTGKGHGRCIQLRPWSRMMIWRECTTS